MVACVGVFLVSGIKLVVCDLCSFVALVSGIKMVACVGVFWFWGSNWWFVTFAFRRFGFGDQDGGLRWCLLFRGLVVLGDVVGGRILDP